MLVGYLRVSSVDLQRDALIAAGVEECHRHVTRRRARAAIVNTPPRPRRH